MKSRARGGASREAARSTDKRADACPPFGFGHLRPALSHRVGYGRQSIDQGVTLRPESTP